MFMVMMFGLVSAAGVHSNAVPAAEDHGYRHLRVGLNRWRGRASHA